MGSMLLPPRLRGTEHETEPAIDPEALIEEARRRQRRRRRRIAGAIVLTVAVGGLAFGVVRFFSGGGSVGEAMPKGLFVNRRAFAGHGVLAFVSRGRLFVFDGKTQKLTAVTAPGERASDPRFSPNGAWLAYTVGTARLGLARSDGSAARVVSSRAGGAAWLPNGDLLADGGIFRVGANSRLVRVGAAPSGLLAWSPDGDRFAFVSRTIVKGRAGAFHGFERLLVAGSLTGSRATWHVEPISFTPRSGFRGSAIASVGVLPHREGILYWVDPGQSASLAADGMSVHLLRAPLAKPVRLAVTIGKTLSAGPRGKLAIGAGSNRYAWITKHVETCDAATARCTRLQTRADRLTLDPAWSPDGKTLAFVEAAAQPESDFRQATIARWYTTHTLWLRRAGATRASELAGTRGAASPVWSSDGKSLLYVSGDALWLIPTLGAEPEKIAGPLYLPNAWPSYYGQVGWTGQFAWASP